MSFQPVYVRLMVMVFETVEWRDLMTIARCRAPTQQGVQIHGAMEGYGALLSLDAGV
jgi:hypothetical protein